MTFDLPLYQQEKDNTCALACLRMILAAFGQLVTETALQAEAQMEPGGTAIEEMEWLARHYQLLAEVRETTLEELGQILAVGQLPLVYLDRAVFDLNPRQRAKHSLRQARVHTVIPVRIGSNYVAFHDPLVPAVAGRSVAIFRHAFSNLGGCCVVCAKRQS